MLRKGTQCESVEEREKDVLGRTIRNIRQSRARQISFLSLNLLIKLLSCVTSMAEQQ